MLFIAISINFDPYYNSMHISISWDIPQHMQSLTGSVNTHTKNRILPSRNDFSYSSYNQKFALIFPDLLIEIISMIKMVQNQFI